MPIKVLNLTSKFKAQLLKKVVDIRCFSNKLHTV